VDNHELELMNFALILFVPKTNAKRMIGPYFKPTERIIRQKIAQNSDKINLNTIESTAAEVEKVVDRNHF
jgi:Ethanolamine utilization protein EutJ (predicted chaperonin)